jgi:aminoglycoside phosphotransferase (APT) family kinase protein
VAAIAAEEIPYAVRAWLPEQFVLRTPEHGATSDVAFVESPGQEALVLKRCREEPYTGWLQNEFRVLRALEGTGLPVPRAIGAHTEADDAGPVWMVTTRLQGTPLWDVVEGAPEDERVALFEQLGEQLGRVHALDVPPELPVEEDQSNWLDRAYHRAASYVRRHVAMALPERLARRLRDRPGPMPRTLVHGDFTLDNVLAENGRITGIIDWGGASAADPRWDVTLALATEPEIHLSPRAVTAFFAGYRKAPLPEALYAAMASAYGWPRDE